MVVVLRAQCTPAKSPVDATPTCFRWEAQSLGVIRVPFSSTRRAARSARRLFCREHVHLSPTTQGASSGQCVRPAQSVLQGQQHPQNMFTSASRDTNETGSLDDKYNTPSRRGRTPKWPNAEVVAQAVRSIAQKNRDSNSNDSLPGLPLQMPKHKELVAAGRGDILYAMQKFGVSKVARLAGLRMNYMPRPSHIATAAQEMRKVAQQIGTTSSSSISLAAHQRVPVIAQAQLARSMPTEAQLKAAGRPDLICAIHVFGRREIAECAGLHLNRRAHRPPLPDIAAAAQELRKVALEIGTARVVSSSSLQTQQRLPVEPTAQLAGSMPTQRQLVAAGRHDVETALMVFGRSKVAKHAGLTMNRAGIKPLQASPLGPSNSCTGIVQGCSEDQ